MKPLKKLDLSGLFPIIKSDSSFNFIRKKNRSTKDNFDYINEFYEEGRHLKETVKVTNESFRSLNKMKKSFPNFIEVINNIESQLELKAIGNKQVKIEPLYLWGEPGIGKTEFILELSKALKLSLEKVNASILSGSFSLSGSESQWADSAPGLVAKSMMKNREANFIFYIDELEKCNDASPGGNPLNALFDLLEESSAQRFVDLAFGDTVLFDATAINFIGSGNSLQGVHPAILSRFNVFEIPTPNMEQLKSIVKNIHVSLLEKNKDDWGSYFDKSISDDVISGLIKEEESVRHVKKNLKNAYINAHKDKRSYLTTSDLVFYHAKTFRMGFV